MTQILKDRTAIYDRRRSQPIGGGAASAPVGEPLVKRAGSRGAERTLGVLH